MRRWSEAQAVAGGWRWRPQPMQVLFRLRGKRRGADERGKERRRRVRAAGRTRSCARSSWPLRSCEAGRERREGQCRAGGCVSGEECLHPVARAEARLGVGRVAGEREAGGGRPPVAGGGGGEELLLVGHAVEEREGAGWREGEWLSRGRRDYAGVFILKRQCGVELCMKGKM